MKLTVGFLLKPSKTAPCGASESEIPSARRLDRPWGRSSQWFLMARFMLHVVQRTSSIRQSEHTGPRRASEWCHRAWLWQRCEKMICLWGSHLQKCHIPLNRHSPCIPFLSSTKHRRDASSLGRSLMKTAAWGVCI